MAIPEVTLTQKDNSIGAAGPNVDGAHVLVGVCSVGTPASWYSFGDPTALVAALGTGPLVEAAVYEMTVGGGPIYCIPVNPSVAGTNSPVLQAGPNAALVSNNGGGTDTTVAYQPTSGAAATGSITHTGTGTGTLSPAGTPTVNAQVLVKILATGSNTTATYQYSLDGGVTWTGSQTLAASITINGQTVTVTGADGAFVQGDTYYWTAAVHGPSGTGTITVTGAPALDPPLNPLGAYDVVVKILGTGAVGTATFTYSLDGGNTFASGTITTAATVALGTTGLTLNFSGNFTATDLYAFRAVATSGAGVGTVAVSGAPLDRYSVVVKIVAGGTNLAAATGTFQYSLDGGNSYSAIYAIPTGGSYVVTGTGLTLTFANGTGSSSTYPAFVAGDLYLFDTVQPGYTTADLQAAINIAIARSETWWWVHVIGSAATASASETIASTISTLLASARTQHRWPFAIMGAADDSDANLESAFTNFNDYQVLVCAGFEDLDSYVTAGRRDKRSSSWVLSARLAATSPGIDPAEFDLGPLPGVEAVYRDERVTPGLDQNRFTTLRTFTQQSGFYITNGQTMETPGGDFDLVQLTRVINKASTSAYGALLRSLSRAVRVNLSTAQAPLVPGAIDERDARRIEAAVNFVLNRDIVQPGDATAAAIVIDRTTNITTTRQVNYVIRVTALGYVKQMVGTIGLQNPALPSI